MELSRVQTKVDDLKAKGEQCVLMDMYMIVQITYLKSKIRAEIKIHDTREL